MARRAVFSPPTMRMAQRLYHTGPSRLSATPVPKFFHGTCSPTEILKDGKLEPGRRFQRCWGGGVFLSEHKSTALMYARHPGEERCLEKLNKALKQQSPTPKAVHQAFNMLSESTKAKGELLLAVFGFADMKIEKNKIVGHYIKPEHPLVGDATGGELSEITFGSESDFKLNVQLLHQNGLKFPSGIKVCIFNEQTLDQRCLFGSELNQLLNFFASEPRVPSALETLAAKVIGTS